jgi:hypothetical protein
MLNNPDRLGGSQLRDFLQPDPALRTILPAVTRVDSQALDVTNGVAATAGVTSRAGRSNGELE